ncbi:hypothetical protein H4R18_001700 [Coemansia javaensis]|uniref:Uncharacterized protein n=1 Tax=Coemansia javaensis TaxID=2761396 RepID=A0A9W8LIS8_9FUNG|nr:hypothetical protein H4R18_001700 [Coemansia javaensis]
MKRTVRACIALICRGAIKSRRQLEAALLSSVEGGGGGSGRAAAAAAAAAARDAFLWKYVRPGEEKAEPSELAGIGAAEANRSAAAAAAAAAGAAVHLARLDGWPREFPDDLDAYREGVLARADWPSDYDRHRAEIAPWVWHHRGRADALLERVRTGGQAAAAAALAEAAAQGIVLDARLERERAAFVVLIRNRELDDFLRTLRQVEARFNRRHHYPYVFLNDEPFTREFMDLVAASTTSNVTFALIPREHWSMPPSIDPELARRARERMEANNVMYGKSLSYRHMCRFNSGFFYKHPLLRDLDWYWRLEPGVDFYCDIEYDPFAFMRRSGKVYSFVIALRELEATIPTLWEHTLEYMLASNATSDWMSYFVARTGAYNLCHFWSNFEIASLRWLRSDAYEAYFRFLDAAGGFFMERWGDAPVHSLAAGMLLNRSQVHFFDDIGYRHDEFARCPDVAARPELRLKCQCPPKMDNFDTSDGSCLPRWKSFRPLQWTARDTAEALRLVRESRRFLGGPESRIAAERRQWYDLFGGTWLDNVGEYSQLAPGPLVRLLGVCGAWYRVVLPLLYRTVRLCLTKFGTPAANARGKTLQQAVDRGRQQHVRRIRIQVFNVLVTQSWGAQSQDAAALVRSCGQLPAVRSVFFEVYMGFRGPCGRAAPSDEGRRSSLKAVSDEFFAVMEAVRQTMPSICHVGCIGWHGYFGDPTQTAIRGLAAEGCAIAGPRTVHLALLGRMAASLPLEPRLGPGLRSITVAEGSELDRSAELIRRCATTLERLHVSGVCGSNIPALFAAGGRAQPAVVYPQLRILIIHCSPESRGAAPVPVDASPFPSLRLLRLSLCPQFPVLPVLRGSRAHLRDLHIDMGAEIVEPLRGGDAFASLDSIALQSTACIRGAPDGAALWYLDLRALCPRARTVRIYGECVAPPPDIGATILLPPNVQALALACFELTLSQVMAICGAYPWLHTAEFCFVDHQSNPRVEAMPPQAIAGYRERYLSQPSSVRRLVLHGLGFKNAARASELVLFLADFLPSVARIEVPNGPDWPYDSFLQSIRYLRKMPGHWNKTRLDAVELVHKQW